MTDRQSIVSEQLSCPSCGAPLDAHRRCVYCGAFTGQADRDQACIEFFTRINQKLSEIPPGFGWLFLILFLAIPVLIIIMGFEISAGIPTTRFQSSPSESFLNSG